ncbi:alpha-N-acetylgalactosaminide alpha-2,6-sialyltransferase 6 [Stigmatopora argus]
MGGKAGERTRRVAILVAILILTTLLILYNSGAGQSSDPPFRVAWNHSVRLTDLKKWAAKDDYVAVHGDQRMDLRCGHCALVSSSSHVLGTKAGPLIDASECVIRMNDAPTAGYEGDVGGRTTLRVVAHSSVYRVLRRRDDFLVDPGGRLRTIFWGPPKKMTRDSKTAVYRSVQRMCSTHERLSCFTVAPAKMYRFDHLFQLETGRNRVRSNSWLSTGWFTMVIAIEICDNIVVYGMVPPNYCSITKGPKMLPYHYYKPRGSDECVTFMQNQNNQRGSHHRFITEKEVFGHWAQQYNITFVHPTW